MPFGLWRSLRERGRGRDLQRHGSYYPNQRPPLSPFESPDQTLSPSQTRPPTISHLQDSQIPRLLIICTAQWTPAKPSSKANDFLRNLCILTLSRVNTAAAVAVPAYFEEPEKPNFLGVEILMLKKIVPLGLMFYCILFNYTILRDTKDVLVLTGDGQRQTIPFLKTWVNLPIAVGFMFLYAKLLNILSKEALFYTVIFPFIAFFGAFAFVLYPLKDAIHAIALADRLLAFLGPSFLRF